MNHDRYEDAYIAAILKDVKVVAMVGASSERRRGEATIVVVASSSRVLTIGGESSTRELGDWFAFLLRSR